MLLVYCLLAHCLREAHAGARVAVLDPDQCSSLLSEASVLVRAQCLPRWIKASDRPCSLDVSAMCLSRLSDKVQQGTANRIFSWRYTEAVPAEHSGILNSSLYHCDAGDGHG